MIEAIYTNGCSWTAGDGISSDPNYTGTAWDFKNCAWPFALGRLMNVPVVNEAEGAGSNYRMVRMTIDYLQNYPKEKLGNLLVVLGWTTTERDELYLENNNHCGWYRYNAAQKFSSHVNPFDKNFVNAMDNYQRQYVSLVHTEYANVFKFMQQVYMMKHLCESLGVKYVFFNSLPWTWTFFEETQACMPKQLEQLNDPNMIDMHENYSFFRYCHEHNIPFSPCLHPMLEGHNAWAQVVHERIENLYGAAGE